jgi:hypothetical protein
MTPMAGRLPRALDGADPAKELASMNLFRRAHDPWWDLEGRGAKRSRIRHKIVADFAFAMAIVACGLTAAAWLRILLPVFTEKIGLG